MLSAVRARQPEQIAGSENRSAFRVIGIRITYIIIDAVACADIPAGIIQLYLYSGQQVKMMVLIRVQQRECIYIYPVIIILEPVGK